MHKFAYTMDNKGYIGTSEREVIKTTHNASVEIRICTSGAIVFGQWIEVAIGVLRGLALSIPDRTKTLMT